MSEMVHFCTYFDRHFLAQGLALHQSLEDHCRPFRLWILCMDKECFQGLSAMNLRNVDLIALEDFERGDSDLLEAKRNRKNIEYYFTCTPSLLLFILDHFPEVEMITYLDADLWFFSSPSPIYDEIADDSIAIVPHRFPPHLRHFEKYGVYNVGWLSFRRDENAFSCLQWWRQSCLHWCHDRAENGLFADQKYLDSWPTRFRGVKVIQHKGANLAPWNLGNFKLMPRGNRLWVDEDPLLFYHFHGLRPVARWIFNPNLDTYDMKPGGILVRHIYRPYVLALHKAKKAVASMSKGSVHPRGDEVQLRGWPPQRGRAGRIRLNMLFTIWGHLKATLSRKYMFIIKGIAF